VECGLRLELFKLVESFAVLTLEVLQVLELDELLLVDDVLDLVLVSLKVIITTALTKTSIFSCSDIVHLFLIRHRVKISFNLVDFGLNLVASFSLHLDLLSRPLHLSAICKNLGFKGRARFRLKTLEL
jgi:hypothetical protein